MPDTKHDTNNNQSSADVIPMPERINYDISKLTTFIDTVFHDLREDENILTWATKGRPGYPTRHDEQFKKLKRVHQPMALYFGTSTCHAEGEGDEAKLFNRFALLDRLHVIVLDDIGTKVQHDDLPEAFKLPSYTIETSPGNFQYGLVLDTPIDNPESAKTLVQLIYDSGFTDSGGAMPTKLVRLPNGVNGKPGVDHVVQLKRLSDRRYTPEELLNIINCELTWAEVEERGADALKRSRAKSVTPWSPVTPSSPNTDGGIDPGLEWMYEQGMVLQETGEWVTIRCPWRHLHTSGDETAGYSPLGRGPADYQVYRGFHCFHEHCADKTAHDLLSWMAGENGPSLPVKDLSTHLLQEWVYDVANDTAIQIRGNKVAVEGVRMGAMRTMFPRKVQVPSHDGRVLRIYEVDLWVQSPARITVDGSVLDPTSDSPLVINPDGTMSVNTFKRPHWDKGELFEDDVEMFLKFIRYLIPNSDEREFFLDWMAAKVLDPGFRGPGILMIADTQGTGRGTLAKMFETLIGQANVSSIMFDKLVGSNAFNAWQMSPLIVVNETFDLGDKNFYRAYERMKSLIELSPTTVTVNRKFKEEKTLRVHSSYLLFSNHTAALNVAADDRRVYVIQNPITPASPKYFSRLYDWMDEPGSPWAPSIYEWFKRREINMEQLLKPAPMTEGKKRMLAATQSSLSIAVRACVTHWEGPVIAVAVVKAVVDALLYRLGLDGQNRSITQRIIEKELRALTLTMHRDYRVRVLGVKNHVRPKLIKSQATTELRQMVTEPELMTTEQLGDLINQNTKESLMEKVVEELELRDL